MSPCWTKIRSIITIIKQQFPITIQMLILALLITVHFLVPCPLNLLLWSVFLPQLGLLLSQTNHRCLLAIVVILSESSFFSRNCRSSLGIILFLESSFFFRNHHSPLGIFVLLASSFFFLSCLPWNLSSFLSIWFSPRLPSFSSYCHGHSSLMTLPYSITQCPVT